MDVTRRMGGRFMGKKRMIGRGGGKGVKLEGNIAGAARKIDT